MMRLILVLLLVLNFRLIAQDSNVLCHLVNNRFKVDSIIVDGRNSGFSSDVFITFKKYKNKKHRSGYTLSVGKIHLIADDKVNDIYSKVKWIKYYFRNDTVSYFSFDWPDDHKANGLATYKSFFYSLFTADRVDYVLIGARLQLKYLSTNSQQVTFYLRSVDN